MSKSKVVNLLPAEDKKFELTTGVPFQSEFGTGNFIVEEKHGPQCDGEEQSLAPPETLSNFCITTVR